MLQSLFILPKVGPNHLAMLVIPCTDTISVHFAILPLALVFVKLANACADAGYRVCQKLALVKGAVRVG